ncbi:spindle poly body spacer protein [Pochonia chlamydosporia 170]|uniref:Spindle poly body spacer protein n=1 Tax=Pochonia chlamydosporia 170 TaxID=1380566 RepID=A0A179F934_METCM|nr:spindle poly body spacer protein [Pochonia chlamydosporia 170]OAQ61948.1 spindle poly body spacer protein [Pochonia chlamydosporia 170]
MFRFWTSDSKGSEQSLEKSNLLSDTNQHLGTPSRLLSQTASGLPAPNKRSWDAFDDSSEVSSDASLRKRVKLHSDISDSASVSSCDESMSSVQVDRLDPARDIIRHQMGLEVLLKHDELRLINQELAKCQVALEQLRRCHLIPYPQHCPTPDQMLDISSGKGPAVITRFGEPVPHWAPPFGVVDGPYARHYAKWLIPDPSFDGEQPEWQFTPEYTRARVSFAEGRTTRNSFTEIGPTSKGRPVRGNAGQKLQALSNGYPQPKDKAGPCILKRSDGQTVKLVCLDCNRENFSSTQGFINHCRIAHKRDFKSHEEAAVQSGHPIDVGETGGASSGGTPEDKTQGNNPSFATNVHPLARQDTSDQQTYAALRSRIADSLKLYHQGKLPGVGAIPSRTTGAHAPGVKKSRAAATKFNPAGETPYLSRLMKSRNFNGDLRDIVADAKTKISIADMTPDEESDDTGTPITAFDGPNDAAPARTPVVKRVPAQSGKTPAASTDSPIHTKSSKSRAAPMSLVSPSGSTLDVMSKRGSDAVLSDEDMDMEEANLSPNTLVSNNAPSLVSDDGEYDDSDDGSSMSGGSDELENESVSDVAEITLDEDHDPRALRRGSNGVSGTVRLRKDDSKKQHVTFLGPVKNRAKDRRTRRT